MKTQTRVAIVVLGYVAALLVAGIVVSLYVLVTDSPDRQVSQGMYAFGDTVVFLGTFGMASLPATGAALYFLRGTAWFWNLLSAIALAIAGIGVVSVLAYWMTGLQSYSWVRSLSLFAPLVVLAAPVFGLGFLISGILAPAHGPRYRLLVSTLVEAVLFISVAFQWFWSMRLMH